MLYLLATLVLLATLATEFGARRGHLPYWVARKILHVVAVGSCAVAAATVPSGVLTWIVGAVLLPLIYFVRGGKVMRETDGRPAWGIVWFALAFFLLLVFDVPVLITSFAMAVLAVCDPAATVAGKLFGGRTYRLTGDPKTVAGNVAFVIAFLLLYLLFPDIVTQETTITGPDFLPSSWIAAYNLRDILSFPSALSMAVLLAAGEALGSKGFDNFIIPLLTVALWSLSGWSTLGYTVLLPILASIPFVWWTVRRGSLTWSGALTAVILGCLVTYRQGPVYLLPLVLFFASSTLIGKVFPSSSESGDAKHGRGRDHVQVLANGGIYALLLLLPVSLFRDDDMLYLYAPNPELYALIAVAVATADTWSSEIGQYFKRTTYDIVRWRKVPVGLSGGISGVGTLAGLAGALFIAVSTEWLIPRTGPGLYFGGFPIIAFGFLGMLIDSVLGSLLQVTYRDGPTDQLLDVPTEHSVISSGYAWATNDVINVLAIAITVALAMLVVAD